MKILTATTLLVVLTLSCFAQGPLHYKLKNIQGTVYDETGKAINIDFHSRRKLIIKNCDNSELETFFRTLTLARHGRKMLEHLLTTSAKINVKISDKVGILYRDGKYRLIAGLTGPDESQSNELILNEASMTLSMRLFKRDKYVWVCQENTIEIFKGSIVYGNDRSHTLSSENVTLFDWHENKEITAFSMDTIKIEELMHPDMMYQNNRELFYFAGLHEIYHTTPENIETQEKGGDPEYGAMLLEGKAFKKRKQINKRKVKR